MTASLLADLDAVGVCLSLAGDDLRYRTRPGVSIAPYVVRIAAHKSALLREILQRRIVEAVDVAPEHFDAEQYDQLQQQRSALPDPEEDITELGEQLEAGWRWLASHPNHPEHERFFARWLVKLDEYERAHAASRQGGTT